VFLGWLTSDPALHRQLNAGAVILPPVSAPDLLELHRSLDDARGGVRQRGADASHTLTHTHTCTHAHTHTHTHTHTHAERDKEIK